MTGFQRNQVADINRNARPTSSESAPWPAKGEQPFASERAEQAQQGDKCCKRCSKGKPCGNSCIAASRKSLDYFLAQHHKQGLSSRLVTVEELFHPTTFETYKV